MEKEKKAINFLNKKLTERILKYKYPLAIVLCGLLLLTFPYKSSNKSPPQTQSTGSAVAAEQSYDVRELEERLSALLSKCDGIGKSEVLLTQSGSIETVYEKNSETSVSRNDSDSDANYERQEQSELALYQNGSYNQTPAVIRYKYPDITGALVVCEGGADDRVKFSVIQAVSAVTGLSSDSISVIKMRIN